MQIYTRKNAEDDATGLCTLNCGIYILDVMSGLEVNGFDLYTDNYYTSPEL